MRLVRWLMVPVLGFLGACIDLDQVSQVKDLRLLAVKSDPPDLLYSFLHIIPPEQRGGIPLGPYNVTTQVLLVDPKGRDVEVSMRLCPEDTQLAGCAGYRLRDAAPPQQINALRPYLDPVTVTRKADLAVGGEISVPSFNMNFSDHAVDYMLPHDVNGELDLITALGFSALPSVVVRARIPDTGEEVVAFKRFSLNLDVSPETLPAQARELLEGLFIALTGTGFCPPGTGPLDDVQCVKQKQPNHNPSLQRVLYMRGGDYLRVDAGYRDDPTSAGQFQDVTGRITVAPGEPIRLRPIVGDADREAYQGLNFDLQSRKIELRNFTEDLVFSWFATVGVPDAQSTEQFTSDPDAVWTVSPDAPDGPAQVWVIVRDQRGGVDWRRLDFDVLTVPDEDPDEGALLDGFEDATGVDIDP